jgi:hypothetical protein
VPGHVIDSLRKAYLHTVQRNTQNINETLRILREFDTHSVPCIPLKGALASESIFGNIALYYATDIDLLVHPSDLEKSKEILSNLGYGLKSEFERDMISAHYHLVFTSPMHIVEAHWNLVKRYFRIDPGFWWEETSTTSYEGLEFPSLSLERYVMYLVFRLFSHEFSNLKFFLIIAELINKNPDHIDWDKLLAFSARYRMRRLVLFTLKLLNDLFDTKVPGHVLKKRICGYGILKKTIVNGLFRERKSSIRKALYLLLLESPLDMFKAFMRRLFPESGELRLRYRIPEGSRKVYLYYVLNPFLLPLMLLKRKTR